MKRITKIVTTLCATTLLLTACSKDDSITQLDGLHVSTSYVSIAEAGATSKITLNTSSDWKIHLQKAMLDKQKSHSLLQHLLMDALLKCSSQLMGRPSTSTLFKVCQLSRKQLVLQSLRVSTTRAIV